MQDTLSAILTYLLRCIGKSPKPVLRTFSHFVYFLLYRVAGYRKKVICDNLKNSFPEKTAKERKAIRKKYYRNIADIFLETLFILQIKKEEVSRYVSVENRELLDRYIRQGRDIALLSGHYGNWEMIALLVPQFDIKSLAIYKPVQNKHFEKLMKDIREKFGTEAVPMKQIFKYLVRYRREKIPTITLYITDQTPNIADIEYTTTFLNQKTPVFLGPEKIAKKWDHAVVYAHLQKLGFARYSIRFELVTDKAKKEPPFAITGKHTRMLEQDIRNKPEYWLWSHRRWKYVNDISQTDN